MNNWILQKSYLFKTGTVAFMFRFFSDVSCVNRVSLSFGVRVKKDIENCFMKM
jgi:hypothetical protein